MTIRDLTIENAGAFSYYDAECGVTCQASFTLFLIRSAWFAGCSFEDLADGFGEGLGTMGGDWSGIRDSSEPAIARMTERAINFTMSAAKRGARGATR